MLLFLIFLVVDLTIQDIHDWHTLPGLPFGAEESAPGSELSGE